MSILTKEDRVEWRELAEKEADRHEDNGWSDRLMLRALDTIDALEAALEDAKFQIECGKEFQARADKYLIDLRRILDVAAAELDTCVVGGHRRALVKIIEILGGEK